MTFRHLQLKINDSAMDMARVHKYKDKFGQECRESPELFRLFLPSKSMKEKFTYSALLTYGPID